jgi:hypothetical protein
MNKEDCKLIYDFLGEKARKSCANESYFPGVFLDPDLAANNSRMFRNELERVGYNVEPLLKIAKEKSC